MKKYWFVVFVMILMAGCIGGGEEPIDETRVGRHLNPDLCSSPGITLVPSIDDDELVVGDVTTASLQILNCYDNTLENVEVTLLPTTSFLDVSPDSRNPTFLEFDDQDTWEFDIEANGARSFNLYFKICFDYSQEYSSDFTVKPDSVGVPATFIMDTGPLNYFVEDLESFMSDDNIRPKFTLENTDIGFVYEDEAQGVNNDYLSSGSISLLDADNVFSFTTRENRIDTIQDNCDLEPGTDYKKCYFSFENVAGQDQGVRVDDTLTFRIEPASESLISDETLTTLTFVSNYTYCYSGSDILGFSLEVGEE